LGNEVAGALDLDLAEVDAGDVLAVVGQCLGDGNAAAAAEVQDAGSGRQSSLQAGEPRRVLSGVVVVAAVAV
jgi:hypothetical protein